jgi:hypothetical protein
VGARYEDDDDAFEDDADDADDDDSDDDATACCSAPSECLVSLRHVSAALTLRSNALLRPTTPATPPSPSST